MKRETLLWIIVALILATLLVWGYFYSQNPQKEEKEQIFTKSYNFLLADNIEERVQGLSGKDDLPDNTVMFFDLIEDEICGVWMKEMKFSIDAVWLNRDFKVIDF